MNSITLTTAQQKLYDEISGYALLSLMQDVTGIHRPTFDATGSDGVEIYSPDGMLLTVVYREE